MDAVLMDTHALFWLLNGERLEAEARVAIAEAQESQGLYISAVTAWEAAVTVRKRSQRPDLGGMDAAEWFEEALSLPGARLVGLPKRIACEAGRVPAIAGWHDPFDCLLIATARIKRIPIVTRDGKIARLARQHPDYIEVIGC